MAESFLQAITSKVDTTALLPPQNLSQSSMVNVASLAWIYSTTSTVLKVCRLIQLAPNKHCVLDPVPTWIVKKHTDELVSFITILCNASLRIGEFLPSQKCVYVTTILKKSNLDPTNTANYRAISNLSFLSKQLERGVNNQLNAYLTSNDLLPSIQSAYEKSHSTETAVLKVLSDVFSAVDNGDVTLLGLLDLSAAFDTVDYMILLKRHTHKFCINGSVFG